MMHVPEADNVFDESSSDFGKRSASDTKLGTLMVFDERYKALSRSLPWGARCVSYARASDLHPSRTCRILSRLQAERLALEVRNSRGGCRICRNMILW